MYFRAILLVLTGVMLVGAMCHRYDEFAGNTGSLKGVVTDSSTGEPVIGVPVVLKGTRIGAITDLDGRYRIGQVPPGNWVVSIVAVGYRTLEIENIVVKANASTRLDAALPYIPSKDKNTTVRGIGRGE
jgi:hypothetical protein